MNEPLDRVLLPDEEANPFCRICLEEDGAMISPCQCTGTLAHVHEGCLRQWRGQFEADDERATRCQQCTALYHVQYVLPRDYLASATAWQHARLWGRNHLRCDNVLWVGRVRPRC